MLIAYSETYSQDNIERCMQKHLYDEPVWYDRDYYTIKEKNGKYYIYMSTPANAFGKARYKRTIRLYFTEQGIRAIERISFFAVMMFVFFVPMVSVCAVGMFFTGDYFMSFVSFGILALCIWMFGIRDKKHIRDFLSRKMQD